MEVAEDFPLLIAVVHDKKLAAGLAHPLGHATAFSGPESGCLYSIPVAIRVKWRRKFQSTADTPKRRGARVARCHGVKGKILRPPASCLLLGLFLPTTCEDSVQVQVHVQGEILKICGICGEEVSPRVARGKGAKGSEGISSSSPRGARGMGSNLVRIESAKSA